MYVCAMATPVDPTFYFSEDGLKAITKALQTGARSVYYGDKRVEFQSRAELVQTRNMILIALGYANPNGGRSYAEFGKGLHRDVCYEGSISWAGGPGDGSEWIYWD